MRWRHATWDDLFRVELQPGQSTTILGELEDTEALREVLARFAWALVAEDDRPVAVFGLSPMWRGVAQAWGLVSLEALRTPIVLTRGVRRLLDDAVGKHGLWRIQASIHAGHDASLVWHERLGFVREGLMTAYGPDGESHHLMALVSQWARP